MTTPNYPGSPRPPGTLGPGLFRPLQQKTVDDAKAAMSGGVMGAFEHTQETLHDEYNLPIGERPTFTQTPIDLSMWATMNPKEHCSIPRSQLINGTASATAQAPGDRTHSHPLTGTPDYVPDGNEGEVAFIRLQRDAKLRHVGFATGDDGLFGSNMTRAHIGVYSVDQDTGTLTLLTPTLAATDIKSQVNMDLNEFIFDMGLTIDGSQNDVYAVVLAQVIGALQTPQSYLGVRMKKTGRWNGTKYPLFQYAWCDLTASKNLPSIIPAANLHWNNDPMTIPFVFLREE